MRIAALIIYVIVTEAILWSILVAASKADKQMERWRKKHDRTL